MILKNYIINFQVFYGWYCSFYSSVGYIRTFKTEFKFHFKMNPSIRNNNDINNIR